MKKIAAMATVSALALAGMVFAAAGGGTPSTSSAVLLPSATTATAPASAQPTTAAAAGSVIADSWICVFRAGAVARGSEQAEANRVASQAGGSVGHVYTAALQGFSIHAKAASAAAVAARNPNVARCEADQIATVIDPVNALANPGGNVGTSATETTPAGIIRVGGGNASNPISGRAFVIDTGIDLTHPDLNVDKATSKNFVPRENRPTTSTAMAAMWPEPLPPRSTDRAWSALRREHCWSRCAFSTATAAAPIRM